MDRRTFLKTSGVATLSTALARPLLALPADHAYMKTIGLQLWTVRNQMEEDRDGTLQAVADAGYKQVELMRVLDSMPILESAKEKGLNVTSAFIDWQSIANPGGDGPQFSKILELANKMQLKHLVFGYIGKGHRETLDHFRQHAENANRAGEVCRKAGIQLCYHNHSFEFEKLPGGKTGFEVFIEDFDTELVKFEVDVFWVAVGGWDPIQTIRRLNNRISQIHLKDLKADTGVIYDEGQVPHEAFQELGDGTIDMMAVMNAAQKAGAEQCHVEQDQSPDPIKSIGQSMQHLRKIT